MKKILSYLLFAGASYLGYSQCTPIVAPWFDGFEAFATNQTINTQNCWRSNDSGVNNPPRWQSENLGTGSSPTGPSGPFAGTRYVYLETSTALGTDSLITPQIDISGLTYPGLKFYYHMFGESTGTLAVDVYDGVSWSPVLWSISGEQQTSNGEPWREQVVSLTGLSGSIIQIRFAGNNVGGTINPNFFFRGDMALDNIEVFECTPSASTISAQSCGYYEAPSGKQLHDAGTYLDTIPNAIGCDSVITINLTTNNTFSTISPNTCGPYTVPSGSYSVGAAGTYYDTIANVGGCDSVITINLTSDNTASTFSTTACNVYTAPSGAQYTLSGVYSDTIANAAGCDSVMTISLDMFFDNSTTIIATVCNPPYIGPSGTAYNTTGTYLDQSLSSINGCDSLVFVNTTIAQGNTQNITISACDEWTSPSGDTTTTSSGTITEIFPGSTGCDSIINYAVSINTVNRIATFVSALTVEAAETGAIYQWVDCNNGNAMIAGATSKTYVSPTNGDFACLVTKNGCTELTNCVRVGSLGIDDENANAFNIYPNPSNGIFSIELTELSSATTVRITNTAGQLVYTSVLNDTKTEISLSNIEAGIYFVSVENATSTVRKAMVIE